MECEIKGIGSDLRTQRGSELSLYRHPERVPIYLAYRQVEHANESWLHVILGARSRAHAGRDFSSLYNSMHARSLTSLHVSDTKRTAVFVEAVGRDRLAKWSRA